MTCAGNEPQTWTQKEWGGIYDKASTYRQPKQSVNLGFPREFRKPDRPKCPICPIET